MKRNLFVLAVVVAFISLFALNAHASFILTFDENGNGTASVDNGTPYSLTGLTGTSPSGFSSALYYDLPSVVGTGALGVYDDFVGGTLSDLLFFETQRMWFYSEPGPDLADLSPLDWSTVLSTYSSLNFGVVENSDGTFAYIIPSDNAYYGTSSPNVVPEPSTFLLLGGGLAGLAFAVRRRRKE